MSIKSMQSTENLKKSGRTYRVIVSLLAWLIIPACIETFEVDYVLDLPAVVVTGQITDKAPAYIELTEAAKTPQTRSSSIPRIAGASIRLIDDLGTEELLTETKRGYYEGTTPGTVGRSYMVEITLPDDRLIISTPQLIKPNPSIDSLYMEPASYRQEVESQVQVDLRGLNINLYMNRKDTTSRYYRWRIGGTYLFFSEFAPNREADPCYYTFPELPSFLIGESPYADSDVFSKTMRFITPNSTYVEGHSMELVQYSQTKEAYDYWKKIDDQQNNLGSIFDPPPAQVLGNLSFVADEGSLALGFFEAASVKTKRVFINEDSFTNLEPGIDYFADRGVNEPCYPPPGWWGAWRTPDFCFDCALLENSSKEKPSYWPE